MVQHRYVKRDTADAIVKGYQGEMCSHYRRAYREAWTLEEMISHKQQWVEEPTRRMYDDQVDDDNPKAPKRQLPHFAQGEMYAYDRLLFAQHQNKLIWTHLHLKSGHRLISGHPDITDHSPEGIAEDKSYHCYAFEFDGKVVWLPFGEEDRAKEVEDGRLTLEQITACVRSNFDGRYKAVQLQIGHKLNGTPQLMKPVPIYH